MAERPVRSKTALAQKPRLFPKTSRSNLTGPKSKKGHLAFRFGYIVRPLVPKCLALRICQRAGLALPQRSIIGGKPISTELGGWKMTLPHRWEGLFASALPSLHSPTTLSRDGLIWCLRERNEE